ncbi:PREDICTED: UBX domain-containing protein 8 isoform X2 [Dipodomys ordii]|uniref:UBX domain-containing protein 8 isoform X2 n=1 Tax=Dipodomys ordii TaxID=10020 RepID=A0A1S3FWK9_DIPOR|nr:PREDICTED: UBX domain-containing protein 8 isoform X2 [Dipodomys ordii]
MASRAVVGIFLLSAVPLLCLELRRGIPGLGIKDLILLCGRIFLLLALLTLIISVTTSLLNSFKSSQVDLREEEKKEEEENELRQRQRLVRKRQQEAQGEKGNEDLVIENTSQTSSETSNREAAKRRNLDKLVTEVSPPAEWPWQKQVITIALRRPSGNVLRRRFFKSCSSQVLFDWMRKIGYHPSLYSLSTSFPRKPLEVEEGCSLADIGITVDTILIVEEKEQGN